ncbi:MAG: phosphoribosylglycinamide formyltransferase [Rhodospirillales bacterium]|jgi:phosphoribosylglycinamide formyltransferase-1|nr:phosphoribosylglycinamide formyltransferase [Rhodospirillales bacterium]HIJ42423.1 phosphoribosylglycinamide formyltransferase [Rhodospirillaceae bacterium]MDP7099080.1 phosphoribosylglycinamide formyltransferase [Rhodospirillales bacterium]MDP7214847.1 phosphoribosylglycinamide formyltransferase [Rhodospirillales bacterium]HIJ45492.1 phosphoribosylglycinamide formyltransferase [Rhodospirillaceae bacterium]
MVRIKLAVLISGRGSNLQSLIDACAEESFPARIVQVISNVPGVAGLGRAEAAGIPAAVVDHKAFEDRQSFEAGLNEALEKSGVDLICLAGFKRLLTDGFINPWRDRLINIHPSLLPAFKGVHAHEQVVESGARFSGCTVHFVRPDMDDGPVIIQAVVPVHGDDDADALAARILAQEHRIYPRAVRLFAEKRLRIAGGRVLIDGAGAPEGALVNPCADGGRRK